MGSILFTTLDKLTLANATDFKFGTGDFTVESWIYKTDTNLYTRWFTMGDYPNIKIAVEMPHISGQTNFYVWINDAFTNLGAYSGFNNTWRHLALTRSGSSVKLFIDGVQHGSTITSSYDFQPTADLTIGNQASTGTDTSFLGNMTNFRVIKGTAQYTGTFNPKATYPLTDVTNTKLLLLASTSGTFTTDEKGKTVTNTNTTYSSDVPTFNVNKTEPPMLTSSPHAEFANARVSTGTYDSHINTFATFPVWRFKFNSTATNPAATDIANEGTFSAGQTITKSGAASGVESATGVTGASKCLYFPNGNNASTGRTYFSVDPTGSTGAIFDSASKSWSIDWWTKYSTTYSNSTNHGVFRITGEFTSAFIRAFIPGPGETNAGKMVAQFAGQSATRTLVSDNLIDDGNWHHYAITHTANGATKLYVDGVENDSDSTTALGIYTNTILGSAASSAIYIGTSNVATTSDFIAGYIDELNIWDYALTTNQIDSNYDAGSITSVSYTASPMLTSSPHAEMKDPVISAATNIQYNADPMLTSSPHAEFVMPASSTGANADAFGVATATADTVMPTVSVVSNNTYNADPATANATSVDATASTTKTVNYSASPATASALLSDNFYGGNTNQDTTYSLHIRQVQSDVATNTSGNSGFTVGTVTSGGVVTNRKATFIIPISGFMERNKIVKVKLDPAHITPVTTSDVSPSNTFNIYTFNTTVNNPTTVIYGDLPAKTLLYTTRLIDEGSNTNFYLDLTPAFTSVNGYAYGVFIEHVTTSTGTDTDQTTFNGNDLNNKALYILAADIINRNINVDPMNITSADTVTPTISVQKYVDYSAAPATADATVVHPTITTEKSNNYNADPSTASAESVQPAFNATVQFPANPATLFAAFQMPSISTTTVINVSIAASPMTADCLFHNPQFQIGENNSVDHMNASALFVMPLLTIPDSNDADVMTASALMVDPSTSSQLLGQINAETMTGNAQFPLLAAYENLLNDKWFSLLFSIQAVPHGQTYNPTSTPSGATNVGPNLLKSWFDVPADLPIASTSRIYSQDPTAFNGTTLKTPLDAQNNPQRLFGTLTGDATSVPTPELETGYFDPFSRKAVRFNNIQFDYSPIGFPFDQVVRDGSKYSLEMSIKTSKNSQIIASGQTSNPFVSGAFWQGSIGTYNGKLYAMNTQTANNFLPITAAPPHPKNFEAIKAAAPDYADPTVLYGRKTLADGQWHHLVVQYDPVERRTQFWIDGELDIQMFDPNITGSARMRPNIFGYNSFDTDLQSDFQTSLLSLSPYKFLSSRQITLHFNAYQRYSPYEATPMTATLDMAQNVSAEGNRRRALMLYWWHQDNQGIDESRIYNIGTRTDLPYGRNPEDRRTGWGIPTIKYVGQAPQQFYDWDVFPLDVSGSTINEFVKPSAVGGAQNIIQIDVLNSNGVSIGKTLANARGHFRDPITDARRYVDLLNDVDLNKFDMIFFANYPDESQELDSFARDEYVDSYFGQVERTAYDDFIRNLRRAVDTGISLFVENPRLALDLGIIDNYELVSQDDDIYDANRTETDTYTLNYVRSARSAGEGTAKFYDSWRNNKHRLKTQLAGLTDDPSFIKNQVAYYQGDGTVNYTDVARAWQKIIERPNGLQIGDEFLITGTEDWAPFDSLNAIYPVVSRKIRAVPPTSVKSGKIITTMGAQYARINSLVSNPYSEYALTIAIEPGVSLRGSQVGGKIFVNLTDINYRQQEYAGVELATDFWIDVAFDAGLITAQRRTELKANPQNYDRLLQSNTITAPEYDNKYAFWTVSGDNLLVAANFPEDDNEFVQPIADFTNPTQPVGKTRRNITSRLSASAGSNRRAFTFSSGVPWAQITTSSIYQQVAVFTPNMNTRALWWLSERITTTGTVIRPDQFIATATSVMPVVVAGKENIITVDPMLASAVATDGAFAKDKIVPVFPMFASAKINERERRVSAEPMTVTAEFRTDVTTYTASVDEVILYVHHEDPILYLREEINK